VLASRHILDVRRSFFLQDHILVWRFKFAEKPTEHFRGSHGVGCEMLLVSVVAVDACKPAHVESQARQFSSCQHHLGPAFWAVMALD